MTSTTKRRWGWIVCLMALLSMCGLGCQPSASQGTTRNAATTTGKTPDNKKPAEPKPDVG